MKSPETCLTYTALSGERKKDVGDAERLLSKSVADFLRKEGYYREAKYIKIIHNFHRSADERGLSQEERSLYNNDLLELILSELMPWHKDNRDFSTLEVN